MQLLSSVHTLAIDPMFLMASMITELIQGLSLYLIFGQTVTIFLVALLLLHFTGKEETENKDQFSIVKIGLYAIQVGVLQYALFGLFLVIDFIFSKMTDAKLESDAIKLGLRIFLSSAIVFVFLEAMLIKIGTALNFRVRKLIYGIALFLVGLIGMFATGLFLSAILKLFAKGAAFHVPFAATVVYAPLFVYGVMMYMKWFASEPAEGTTQTCMPFLVGIVNKSSAPAAAYPTAAAVAPVQPVAQQQAQPFGQPQADPFAQQQPQQQAFGQQQPVAEQTAAAPAGQSCPTCGGSPRYIEQYSRYWCDSCNKYL